MSEAGGNHASLGHMSTLALEPGRHRVTLLSALTFPLQLPSMLFVVISSLILALVTRGQGVLILTAILPIYLMLVWLTQFAFKMIDDVAHGRREASTATAEMLSPFGDARCWVHPALVAAIALLLFRYPQLSPTPVLTVAWLLFPASIGAIAVSGRIVDALNPISMWQVMRGLGRWYLLLLGATLLASTLEVWILRSDLWKVPRLILFELILLECYALIGGTLHLRRLELGFEPINSPERELERAEQERQLQRQHMFDDVYGKLRVREYSRAIAAARNWLAPLPNTELHRDVTALLEAGRSWSEPRAFGMFAQDLITHLLLVRQLALALATAEEALRQLATFAPSQESEAVALARYALQSGRKRMARSLLENYVARSPDQKPGAELLALQGRLTEGIEAH